MSLQGAERSCGGRRQKTVILLLVFLIPIGLAAWWTLESIELQYRRNLQDSLEAVVSLSHEGLLLWAEDKKAEAASWAQSEPLRQAVEAQLEIPRTGDSLKASPAAERIRQLLEPAVHLHSSAAFLVLAPDGTVIASDLEGAVGLRTLLMIDRALIEGALGGEPQLSPPLNGLIPGAADGSHRPEQPALFVAAPIRGDKGSAVAVLVFALVPERGFTRVVQLGRTGQTGETYAFNRHGQIITGSRFDEQSRQAGLLGPGETSVLNIELRDPGRDLTQEVNPAQPRPQQPLTLMAASALSGHSGSNLTGYRDYRGVPVVGSWIWSDSLGMGLATEIDAAEAFQPLMHTQVLVLGLLLLAVCAALVLAWILDRRARQLHEALTLRDDFLSLASHELKTPLTVLQLVTQRLVVAVTGPSRALSSEKQEKLAATLTRHVRRLNHLLEAMFEVAQFEAEGLTLEREPVELLQVVHEALRQLRTEIISRRVLISVEAHESIVGLWDRARLEQMVLYLLSNALKFGEGRPIEVSLERHLGVGRLSVQDHGIGIAPEAQLFIFERFGHAVSARHFGGLGLSLCRVRQIVEAHGGQIDVKSTPGAGATFTVELPLTPRFGWWQRMPVARAPEQAHAPPSAPPSSPA